MRLACVGVLEHALRLLRLACVGVLEHALRLLVISAMCGGGFISIGMGWHGG